MYSQLFAGAFLALGLCFCATSIVSFAVHLLGKRDPDYLVFGLMTLAVATGATATGGAFASAAGSDHASLVEAGIAQVAWVLTGAFHMHSAARLTSVPHRRLAIGAYALAGIASVGLFIATGSPLALGHVHELSVRGSSVRYLWASPSVATWLALSFAPLAHATAAMLFARAYLRERSTGVALLLGAVVVTLTSAHDSLVTGDVVRSIPLVPAGFLVQSCAVGIAFVSRFVHLRAELLHRSALLDERAEQLRNSQKQLADMHNELVQKKQLAAIGEMAAVIAHEVRNPLAIVGNAVAGLRREAVSREDHDVLLGIITEEADRLNRLVSDLLSFARPISLQRTIVHLRDLAVRTAAFAADRTKAQIVVCEDSDTGQIWGDADLLRQVYDNLVDNAAQATTGDGAVTIVVRPAAHDGVDGYETTVTDNGEGMDTLVRSRAMAPFFTTRSSGTGLGLAIVNRIVQAHGGTLSLDSKPGEGTTVRVFLPIGSEPAVPSARAS